MDLDAGGATGAVRFYTACIRSAARLTYEQVQDFLEGKGRVQEASSAAVQASLLAAAELAALLLSRRKERGSLDFELPEPAYSFDEAGRIAAIVRRERLFSHRIIEECMIAANEAVARFLEERALPALYRVHPLPEAERLTALFRSLRTVEWTQPMPQRPSSGDLPAFLRAARGTPQEFLVGRLCLRAMMQARYQPENEGHFGLASGSYCHFTSPIRRYADIVVHRALKYALKLFSGPLVSGGKLLALADRLNRRERAAMEAEREMARRLAVLLLAGRVGEHFDGVISSVNEFGFFVELCALPVEGLVRLMDLADDFYVYDPDRQLLLGRNTGRQFRLGQPLPVVLADVHKGRLEISLMPEEQAGFSSASRRRRSRGKGSA
jgi:ribonuclease R